MAYTLNGLVGRVQRRIRDTGYSSSEIIEYINDAINDVFNEYPLPFTETTQDYTLASGVSDITNGSGLPTNFVQAKEVILTSAGYESALTFIDYKELDRMYPDPDDVTAHPANVPAYFYKYGTTIRVFPAPNSEYTVTLKYSRKPTALASDADVPILPSEFEEIIVLGAAYRVLQVKDNYDQAAILQNKYDEILQKLVMKYTIPQTGTPLIMRSNYNALGKTSF